MTPGQQIWALASTIALGCLMIVASLLVIGLITARRSSDYVKADREMQVRQQATTLTRTLAGLDYAYLVPQRSARQALSKASF